MNTTDNIYGIIEGALWCKGYYGSSSREIDCKLDDRGARSIMQLKADAGLDSSNISISALLMKALLSMDQFVLFVKLRWYKRNSRHTEISKRKLSKLFGYHSM